MTRKSLLVLVAVLIGVAIAVYFVRQREPQKPKIAFLLKTLSNPFFVEMKTGIENYKVEQKLGDRYVVDINAGPSESNVDVQRQYIEQYILKKYDVLCITPSSSTSLNDVIGRAIKAGVKVIAVDTKIDEQSLMAEGVSISAYVGSNNLYGGTLAAEFILKAVNNKAPRIIFFEGVPDQETAEQRKKGFFNVLSSQNLSVVEHKVADWNKQKAYDMMNNIIARHVQFDAIFASNDQMALGVVEALENNKISPSTKVIVGFDAIPEAINAIKEGHRLTATVRQKPRDMGYLAMQIAVSLLENKTYAKDNPIDVEIVN